MCDEEIPPRESLLQYCSFTEPAPFFLSKIREKQCGRRSSLHKDGTAHLNPSSQTPAAISHEPVFADGEAWMVL